MFFAGTVMISYYGAVYGGFFLCGFCMNHDTGLHSKQGVFQTLYCLKWLGSPQELDHAKKLGAYDELVVLE